MKVGPRIRKVFTNWSAFEKRLMSRGPEKLYHQDEILDIEGALNHDYEAGFH